jgi:ABC-2 type transport system ATP-binding protein
LISVKNLSKSYGSVHAVRSISFDIHDGEIVGFLGANGAGKSTTLKIMTGYISPSAGNVYFNDYNIYDHSFEIQKDIGYLPEVNPLYTEMKVYDYLEFNANIRNIKGQNFKNAFQKVVDECGLSDVVHRTIGNCSKGFRQRIGLATAMIHNPKILILDEPVSGLDPNQIVEIRQLIKKLGREKIVIMSSHILQEIQATVDRIIIINNGEIVADGTSDDLLSDASGKTRLTMEVENAEENVIQDMKATIPAISIQSINKENGLISITIEYPKGSDPRHDIFNYAIENNWIILEMVASKQNLEEIFRNLTKNGDSAVE